MVGLMARQILINMNLEFIKKECNRYVNRECTTLGCFKRGGWIRGGRKPPKDFEPTCQVHELVLYVEKLEKENKSLHYKN